MEHLIRFLSWTFVFGAIATLLYTNFKPTWKELLDADIAIEDVQGTAADPASSDGPANTGGESRATPATAQKECKAADPAELPSHCANPSS